MANRFGFSFKEEAIDVINILGRTRISRVQRSDLGSDMPSTPVYELGSDKQVGRIQDIPTVSVTISAMDVGPRTIFTLAGTHWAAAPSGSYVEIKDIKPVTLAQTFKGATSDDIARSIVVPCAQLERFTFNYSVGSDATEEYSFTGTTKHVLKYDLALISGNTSAGAIALSPAARQLSNSNYYVSVFAGSSIGYVLPENITASATGSLTFDTADIPNGTFVVATYHSDLTNQWDYTYEFPNVKPNYTPAPDQPIGVRGYGVEISLVKGNLNTTGAFTSEERVYRAQTCSVQGTFTNEQVAELGTEQYVGYISMVPDVTGTLEILENDFRVRELLANATSDDNYMPSDLGEGDWGLRIKLFRRGVSHITAAPEKTIWIPALDITNESDNAAVQQSGRLSFSFSSRTGECYVYKGNRP